MGVNGYEKNQFSIDLADMFQLSSSIDIYYIYLIKENLKMLYIFVLLRCFNLESDLFKQFMKIGKSQTYVSMDAWKRKCQYGNSDWLTWADV